MPETSTLVPSAVEETSAVTLEDKNGLCYACGRDNALGLKVPFTPDGENGSLAFYIAQTEHAGWPGLLHGGILFTLMDESLGWALYYKGLRGVTAKTETRFRKSVRVGTPLVITGRVERVVHRLAYMKAAVERNDGSGEIVAELSGTMYLLATSNK